MGKHMTTIGREQAIMIGMVLNMIQQAGLYFTLSLKDDDWFLFFSFVC